MYEDRDDDWKPDIKKPRGQPKQKLLDKVHDNLKLLNE